MKKSAVEISPCRRQIEEMILAGETDRYISDWTKKHDCYIGKTAINNYRKKYNPNKKAKERYHNKKSKERLDKATDKIVSDLEYCDNLIKTADNIVLKVDPDKKIDELDIKKIGLAAIRTKNEILKAGDDGDKDITIKIESVKGDNNGSDLEASRETSE